jgi:hypothetical protein
MNISTLWTITLKNLEFREGVLFSVKLGVGNEGTVYILRLPRNNIKLVQKNIFKKILRLFHLRGWP